MLLRVHPRADGAHDRNRTGDLLLTMEMLYRLSYVGAHDRDHPSGQRGSDAERKERWTGRCGRAGAARVCVEKTHHPEGVSLAGSRLGVSRETGNLGSEAPAVNAKLGRFRVCGGGKGQPLKDATILPWATRNLRPDQIHRWEYGAGNGIRTRDPRLGRPML